ncbi:hypothetical protein K8W59_03010 [Nocardioides rotundus]|uniref:hypothetical protein n=1 Tax=Nocardioides rotundus TaxID=1774216 RepID=UPI001CC074D0|nr:hypothetical protein [Nocardioides rotundus]UAL30511.1 hypothetical protein K8W59_03010 [Nocardioides rotundus]
MELITGLEELADGRLLDHAGEVARARRELEVQELRVALSFVVRNNPDRLDPGIRLLPGRERARRYGGVGTDEVTEFCCAELGARMGITSFAAAALMADAVDLVVRLPQLWARVEAFEVKVSYARYVARKTRDLSIEQAEYVDSRVAESADGRVPWTRFEELVAAAIVASNPAAAAAAEEKAQQASYARVTRSDEHGMRGLYVRAGFPVIAKVDAMLALVADALAAQGVGGTVDERRALALLVLCDPRQAIALLAAYRRSAGASPDPAPDPDPDPDDPGGDDPAVQLDLSVPPEAAGIDWAALLPTVELFVHCYAGPEPTGIARVEGQGPVTQAWVRTVLGERARFTVRPVLDLEGQAPVDAYEIPDRHRRAVHLMTPADIFPWGSSRSRSMQIDHTVPHPRGRGPGGVDPAGLSEVGNYGPMTGFHHRVKTHGGWQVAQPFPGIYLWRDPHGATYLVDHTGTRRIDAAWTRHHLAQAYDLGA